MGKERKYINNLARSMMGEYGTDLKRLIPPDFSKESVREFAKSLGDYNIVRGNIMYKLRDMKPETLGKIAAFGLERSKGGVGYASETTLYDVLDERYFTLDKSGKHLLAILAYGAIMAEIVNIIRKHFKV